MTNEEILKNTPEGATHYRDSNLDWAVVLYYKQDFHGLWFWSADKWLEYDYIHTFVRSLDDIRRIVELEGFIRRYRYNIKQNAGDGTQRMISGLLGDKQ